MARIGDLLAHGRTFSFEFFPPRNPDQHTTLVRTLRALEPLEPSFVSVTYGAGGSTRERTHDLVVGMLHATTLTPMAHLTCVCHTRLELAEILVRYRQEGIENLMALGGDPPVDREAEQGELQHASELVELARAVGGFSIGVAAHPEGHPRSRDLPSDRAHLARKLELADFAVTQFFFRVEDYLGLVDDLSALGVDKPVIPGVMPVTNVRQVERFAQLSGAEFPADLAARLHAVADQPDEVRRIGVEVATELCQKLLAEGVPGLHFYTLNQSGATRQIYANLGLGPVPAAGA